MKTARQLTIAILLVTALAAFIGGFFLVSDSSGHSLQLSTENLKGTPFQDYSTPAWLLILFVGVLSLITAGLTARQSKGYTSFVILEGVVVLVFILTQIILIDGLHFTEIIFGLFGFALILLGRLLYKNQTALAHHNPQQQIHHSLANAHKKSHYHKHRKRGQ